MCETNFYTLWNRSAIYKWEQGLRYLLNPWVGHYVSVLNLSSQLVDSLEIWRSLYVVMQPELQSLIINNCGDSDISYVVCRKLIIQSLQQFSERCNHNVAVELDRWVRRHFFCLDIEISLGLWCRLIRAAYRFEVPSERRVQPPDSLIHILQNDRMANLIDMLDISSSHVNLNGKNVRDFNFSQEMNASDLEYEIGTSTKIISECATIQILQELSIRLSFWDVQDVVRWAFMQHSIWRTPSRFFIQADRLIRKELPCYDTPSILEMYA